MKSWCSLFNGYGWEPYFVEGDDPMIMHQAMSTALDLTIEKIKTIQKEARENGVTERPRWPMIILRSPKGWTGPKEVNGFPVEGAFRSHQVPITDPRTNPASLQKLEEWLRSYGPQELFDEEGRLIPELAELAPKKKKEWGRIRMPMADSY